MIVVLFVPEQTVVAPAIDPPTETGSTVMAITLVATADDQSAMQDTLARRLYQVFTPNAPGAKEGASLPDMSANPEAEPAVDFCHLYSSAPDCPEGSAVLDRGAGVDPAHISWSEAMVPADVGLVQL